MHCRFVYCICSLLFGFIGALTTLVALLLWSEFDSLYGETVRNQMSIDNQSFNWWFDKWHKPPVKHSLTIHIFELENIAEWRRSPAETKPFMREIGPFVFSVEKRKENWNFSDNDHYQVWYNERTSYHFNELLSYQNLDKTAIVANAELMILAPFINSMVKRIATVSRISRSLNSTASQILSIYRSNLFVERSINRIIFGPESLSVNYTENINKDNNNVNEKKEEGDKGEEDEQGEEDEEDKNKEEQAKEARAKEEKNKDISTLSRIENVNPEVGENTTSNNKFSWIINQLRDNSTIQILQLYDKASTYFEKLGVEKNPFELIAAQFDKNRAVINDEFHNLRANSMLSFYQNNSLEHFDLWTGKNQPGRQARLLRWNNQNKLRVWSGKRCNEINGTDGRQYSPFLKRRRIYLFERRICRSIPFTFESLQNTPLGIDIHRYNRSIDFLLSPVKAPSNNCFCRSSAVIQKRRNRPISYDNNNRNNNNNKRCNYDGILDLSSCYTEIESLNQNENSSTYGSLPLMLTAVHFSGPFTKSIAREVMGVIPDEQLYQSVLDIEPVSGIVLHRTVKYQFNLHFTPLPVGNNRTTREVIVPLLWQDEQFTVNADHLNSIKYLFVYPYKYRELAILIIGTLGGAFIFFSTLFLCCCCCSKSKTNHKVQMIEESITKGTAKYNGKVVPIDNNNNTQTFAWDKKKIKHQQTEEDDEFQFDVKDANDEDYDVENVQYGSDMMINSQNRQQYRNDKPNYYYENSFIQNQDQNYAEKLNRGGGNHYPLERLKRDMPARQSATNIKNHQSNKSKQWQDDDNDQSIDYYQNRFDSGYDNNYDDNLADDRFINQSNGQRIIDPPASIPVAPASLGILNDNDYKQIMPPQRVNAREDLLRQIRAGTQLKRIGDLSNEVETFDKQMTLTSMLIIQQILTQQHEQIRWHHDMQVLQDTLIAQRMSQLMPFVSLSLPQYTLPNYVPTFHHEQTEAILLEPNNLTIKSQQVPMTMDDPIILPSFDSKVEYSPHSYNYLNNQLQKKEELTEDQLNSGIRHRSVKIKSTNDVDEYNSTSSSSEAQNKKSKGYESNAEGYAAQSQINEFSLKNATINNTDAIRFYGPYRAYNIGSKVNERNSASTLSFVEKDNNNWDSDFDNDDGSNIDDDHNNYTNTNIKVSNRFFSHNRQRTISNKVPYKESHNISHSKIVP